MSAASLSFDDAGNQISCDWSSLASTLAAGSSAGAIAGCFTVESAGSAWAFDLFAERWAKMSCVGRTGPNICPCTARPSRNASKKLAAIAAKVDQDRNQ